MALAPPLTHSAADSTNETELPFDLVQLGVPSIGDILVEKLVDTEDASILAATNQGLYIIREQTLQCYIPTSSQITYMGTVADISDPPDGRRDVVVALNEDGFANVRCYDAATGQKLWQHSHVEKGYRSGVGWAYYHAIPQALAVTADNHVVYAAGDRIYVLDGATGKALGSYKTDPVCSQINHISVIADVNGDGAEDILATATDEKEEITGHHRLYVINGNNGGLIRCIKSIPALKQYAYYDEDVETLLDSIAVLDMNGQIKVAVTSYGRDHENLYLVDLNSGAI